MRLNNYQFISLGVYIIRQTKLIKYLLLCQNIYSNYNLIKTMRKHDLTVLIVTIQNPLLDISIILIYHIYIGELFQKYFF